MGSFLVDHPIPNAWELKDDLPGEDVVLVDIFPPWKMYFDGVARHNAAGVRVVFISPEKHILTYSFMLSRLCFNNMVNIRH